MNSFLLKIKKTVSSFLIVAMTQMIVSPIFLNQTYAAATLSVSTEVPTPTNIVTPSYSFVSDTNGTIIYGGSCTSSTTIANTGSNSIAFDTLPEGTYSDCTVAVDDGISSGNTLTVASFTIDTTAPVVILSGSAIVNIVQSGSYTELGADWTDNIDGVGYTGSASSGSVDVFTPGTYILEYTHTDVAGNLGNTVTRTVNVNTSDLTPPVVTLIGSATGTVLSGSIYVDSGATWSDNIDGTGNTLTGIYGSNGSFQTGGTFVDTSSTGTFTIEYLKVDAAGNTGSVTRTIEVVDSIPPDTTAPVVTLIGSATGTVLSGSIYVDSGATWSDNIDGTGNTLTGIYGSNGSFQTGGTFVDTSSTGTFTIEYLKVDAAGNTGSVIRTIIVTEADTTPPTASIVYSTTGATNQNVIATLTGASEAITITNNSGSVNYTFTTNGSFTFDFVDAAGNTGSAIATVSNIDQVVPTATIEYSPSTTTSGAVIATLTGASETITVTNNSGATTYTFSNSGSFTFEFQDAAGNTGSTTATVNWIDTTAPVVTLVGSGIINILSGSTYSDSGAIWTDNFDGSGTVIASGSVNTAQTGTYILTYTKIDVAGNISNTVTRTVNVLDIPDTIPPVITLIGSGTLTISQGSIYIDSGATWTDNLDGSGTIIASGSVNTAQAGTYTLTYHKIDSSGNIATIVTRTIVVVDQTAPTAMVIYSTTGSTNQPVVATLTGASENITITNNSGSNTFIFTSNGVFTFNFVDSSGNTGSAIATVSNIDQVAPVVTLIGNAAITLYQNSIYNESGALWSDLVDGTGVLLVPTTGTVNMTVPGTYMLTYTKVDTAGNTGSVSRTVTVLTTFVNPIVGFTGPGGGATSSYTSSVSTGFIFDRYITGALLPPQKVISPLFPKRPRANFVPLFSDVKLVSVPKNTTPQVSTVNRLTIRSSARISSRNIIGYLKKGQTVDVISVDANGWALILLSSGKTAFVKATFLSKK